MSQTIRPTPLGLLKLSLSNLQQNPVILYPTVILVFVQLLVLEILYFSPREPISIFFAPLIRQVWSEEFLHYPLNLVLLPKIFYYAQVLIYLFAGSFLLGVTARLIAILDERPKANLKAAFRETSQFYIHIFCAALILFFFFQMSSNAYTAFSDFILKLKTEGQSSAFLEKVFLQGGPYVQFFIGILVTTLQVFVVPVIVLDRKKIFPAVKKNFRLLAGNFPVTFLIVLIPTLFYLPILVARNNIGLLIEKTVPEVQALVIIAGILVTLAIDLVILSAVTIHYLFIKDTLEKFD